MHGTNAYAPHVTYTRICASRLTPHTPRTRPGRRVQGLYSHLPVRYPPTVIPPPQGLSRFASDIIIRGFDTPCKLGFYDGKLIAIVSVHVTLPLPLPLALPLPLPLPLTLALAL